MKGLCKSACREIIHHRWSGQKERSHRAEATSWMAGIWSAEKIGKVSWPPFMTGCFPINSKCKCLLLTEGNSHQAQLATLMVPYSLIKVRLICSPPRFQAYITKALSCHLHSCTFQASDCILWERQGYRGRLLPSLHAAQTHHFPILDCGQYLQ